MFSESSPVWAAHGSPRHPDGSIDTTLTVPHDRENAQSQNTSNAAEYSHLFRTLDWKVVTADFEMTSQLPRDDMIAAVNVVPRIGDRWLLVQFSSGVWWVPGGTREPGEELYATLQRELLEEAGAELGSVRWLGAWKCHSTQPKPYRSHIPHPVFYRAVAIGQARVTCAPTMPPDGETVVDVAVVSLDEAVERFRSTGRDDLADLYRLANAVSGGTGHHR